MNDYSELDKKQFDAKRSAAVKECDAELAKELLDSGNPHMTDNARSLLESTIKTAETTKANKKSAAAKQQVNPFAVMAAMQQADAPAAASNTRLPLPAAIAMWFGWFSVVLVYMFLWGNLAFWNTSYTVPLGSFKLSVATAMVLGVVSLTVCSSHIPRVWKIAIGAGIPLFVVILPIFSIAPVP